MSELLKIVLANTLSIKDIHAPYFPPSSNHLARGSIQLPGVMCPPLTPCMYMIKQTTLCRNSLERRWSAKTNRCGKYHANAMYKGIRGKKKDINDFARSSSEVLVKAEVAAILTLLLGRAGRLILVLLSTVHDTGLLVVGDTLLKEVGLATKRDVLHEVEGVGRFVDLVVAESDQQTISDELDVLLHQVGVHAQEGARQSLGQELLLDLDSIDDNILNHLLAGAVLQVRVQKAGKVGVETLITGDELVGEGQTGHETTLLEPEDGGESTAEEDALDGGKGNEALGEGGLCVRDPAQGPVSLLTDAGDGVDGVEEIGTLGGLLNVGVDEKGVSLGVNVLHHDLEAVEAARLGDLDFARETLNQVLIDDAVGSGEEGENVRDEVLLIIVDLVVPVVEILGQINLLSSPERGLGLLVHLPNLCVKS